MNGQSGGYIQTSSADPPQISILNGPYSKGMVPTTRYFLKVVRFHRHEDLLVRMRMSAPQGHPFSIGFWQCEKFNDFASTEARHTGEELASGLTKFSGIGLYTLGGFSAFQASGAAVETTIGPIPASMLNGADISRR